MGKLDMEEVYVSPPAPNMVPNRVFLYLQLPSTLLVRCQKGGYYGQVVWSRKKV